MPVSRRQTEVRKRISTHIFIHRHFYAAEVEKEKEKTPPTTINTKQQKHISRKCSSNRRKKQYTKKNKILHRL